jgi:hypothetical protein
MSHARSLLARVRKLEAEGRNPILGKIGSVARLEQTLSEENNPDADPRAGEFFVMCVRRWIDGTDRTSNDPVPEEFRSV